MKTLQVVFERALRSAAIARPDDPEAIQRAIEKQALQTLETIGVRMSQIESGIQTWMQELREHSVCIAIDIAKAVLQTDDELIETRVRQFADFSLESIPSTRLTAVCVHPDCADTIRDWIQSSELGELEIRSDPRIDPGDCRLESGDAGVMATLESCFHSVVEQLTHPNEKNCGIESRDKAEFTGAAP